MRNNIDRMEVPAGHVLRTTYALYAYTFLSGQPIEDWEHAETKAGANGPDFVYNNNITDEVMTVATGSPNGYTVVVA